MIALLDAIEAALDPHDPVHANARGTISRCRELNQRAAQIRAEAERAIDDGNLQRAQALLDEGAAVLNEMAALNARARDVSSRMHRVTERMQ